MKKDMYAVFDTASGVYDGPIPGVSNAHMVRHFSDMATNPEHPIGQHPEDYSLVLIGVWNDGTGEVTNIPNETLITGLEAVAAAKNA